MVGGSSTVQTWPVVSETEPSQCVPLPVSQQKRAITRSPLAAGPENVLAIELPDPLGFELAICDRSAMHYAAPVIEITTLPLGRSNVLPTATPPPVTVPEHRNDPPLASVQRLQ